MSRLDDLQYARRHLSQAVDRSKQGVVIGAEQHASAAVDHLRYSGCDDIADRVDKATLGGVAAGDARIQMREAMQLIDAEIVAGLDSVEIEKAFVTEVSP